VRPRTRACTRVRVRVWVPTKLCVSLSACLQACVMRMFMHSTNHAELAFRHSFLSSVFNLLSYPTFSVFPNISNFLGWLSAKRLSNSSIHISCLCFVCC
jgi:hypothetical protein